MYSRKRIIKDKSIIIMSIVSVMAISGLVAGIMISGKNKSPNTSQIAEIESSSDKKPDKNTTEAPTNNDKDAAANVNKETTTKAEETTQPPTEPQTEPVKAFPSEEATKSRTVEETSTSSENGASVNAPASSLSFTNNSILVWPVETNDIVIEFSMDTTTYFATLDMYKTSDAVCIRSSLNAPVYAAADGIVTANSYNEETGRFISMDLGNNYELTYGQLKDIQVDEGSAVAKGDLIGYISEPTKYYTVEGANLYLKLTCDGSAVDPLDYLNYEEP